MKEHLSSDQIFISRLTEIILANLGDENFDGRELASKAGMSPRSLNQRLHAINNKTITQFICEVRLRKALEILKNERLTASEVSYIVGFNSPTYFNSCFKEFFGYPPGKVKRVNTDIIGEIHPFHPAQDDAPKRHSLRILILTLSGIMVLVFLGFLVNYAFFKKSSDAAVIHLKNKEKSIAVLPFKNLSESDENQYFIDGVMEDILRNLSHIHDLRVISRTSVEQFRVNTRSTSEIANMLDVSYVVEGSGQKYGNTFRLRVQLIEASTDRHIWAESYEKEIRETKDIFSIQNQIAQAIASELKATIAPEEKLLIEKSATDRLTAYDFYQRGREETQTYCMDNKNIPSLKNAKVLYKRALENDSAFALSYAGLAEVYWYEHFNEQLLSKRFLDSVLILCNIALSYDDKVSLAYIIRGDYYRETEKPELAIQEYDKAIRINPNDYAAYLAKGVLYYWSCDFILAIDNFQKAMTLNRDRLLPAMLSSICYAYLASGFAEKARNYCMESFRLSADSLSYYYVLSDIESCPGNYKNAINYLEKAFARDSVNSQILFGLGKNYMLDRQKEKSLNYFKKYLGNAKKLSNEDLFGMYRIGWAYWQNGNKAEAEDCFSKQLDYSNKMIALGRTSRDPYEVYLGLAGIYAFKGEKLKAYKNLEIYYQNKKIDLWDVSLVKNDPMFDGIRNESRFQRIVKDMEAKYQTNHEKVKQWLEEKGQL